MTKPKRFLLILVQGIVILLIAPLVVMFLVNPVTVIVRNDSDELIRNVSVSVWNKTLIFPDLQPGSSHRRWFRNTGGDGHYTLHASRSDGMQIASEKGYITGDYIYGCVAFTFGRDTVSFDETYIP